jgi:hypothetical protein
MAEQYVEPRGEGFNQPERPIRELLTDLWENTETLVRQELKLASAELESKVADAKADLLKVALGGAALYAGAMTLVAALVLFVAKFVAPWVAALLVGIVVVGLGYFLLQKGKDLKARNLKPERTVESLREDVRTFREAVK